MTKAEATQISEDDLDALLRNSLMGKAEMRYGGHKHPATDASDAKTFAIRMEGLGWKEQEQSYNESEKLYTYRMKKEGTGMVFAAAKTLARAMSEAIAQAICKDEELVTPQDQ